ncbi:MAG: hypothetical protein QM296_09100 [Bacillota bacterium]|nr:hypothetical protein [Bacillota bacterium]
MKQIEFYERVQALLEGLGRKELQAVVSQLATLVAEDQREAFLKLLQTPPGRGEAERLSDLTAKIKSDLEQRVEKHIREFEPINRGKRVLDSRIYWKPDKELGSIKTYVVYDKRHILKGFNAAVFLLHECLRTGLYDLGYRLAMEILDIRVQVTGPYLEHDTRPLTIYQLDRQSLLSRDYGDVLSESFFFTYMVTESPERPARIYEMIESNGYWPSLERILRLGGGTLPGFAEFLQLWLSYLASRDEKRVNSLLKEALKYENDLHFLLTLTHDYDSKYPWLYEDLLSRLKRVGKWKEILLLGQIAIERLPEEYVIRSEIAMSAAAAAWKLGQVDPAEECCLVAFESHCHAVHYLRLRFSCRDWTGYADRVRAAYENAWRTGQEPKQSPSVSGRGDSLRRNELDPKAYLALLLFDERFREALDFARENNPAKSGYHVAKEDLVSLALPLLCQASEPGQGMLLVLVRAVVAARFGAASYNEAAAVPLQGTDGEALWSLIQKWKAEARITEAEREKYLTELETFVFLLVDEILGNQDRENYEWAAAWLVALGEVWESCGHEGRKAELVSRFLRKYPRLSSFKKELGRYGEL